MYLSGKSHYIRSPIYQRGKACNSRGLILTWRVVASLARAFVLLQVTTLTWRRIFCLSFLKLHGFKTSRRSRVFALTLVGEY